MTCFYPRKLYKTDTGHKFERPSGHSGAYTKIPCRKCFGCRMDYKSEWATRMMHEASCHEDNLFLTLTYDQENLPESADLVQRDMQLFWKNLRKKFPHLKIRYVYSAEFGKITKRPHYHAIAFGLALPDLIKEGRNDRGEPLYGSEILDKIWKKGHCVVGAVTEQSCGYVAGYMLKDMDGDYINEYTILDEETGELVNRTRPYARHSNKPGIGRIWFEKYWRDVFPDDFIVVEGKKRSVPEYYLRLLEQKDPEMHAQVQAKRETALEDPKTMWNSTPGRLEVRETVFKAKLGQFRRGSDGD